MDDVVKRVLDTAIRDQENQLARILAIIDRDRERFDDALAALNNDYKTEHKIRTELSALRAARAD